MSALNFGHNWENITTTTTGAGSVTVSGEVMSCSSIAGDNAKAAKSIYLLQGDTIRVSVMARLTSGVGPIGGISVAVSGDKARVFCKSEQWERLELTYSLPMTAQADTFVTINMGVFTGESGSIEYSDPKIDILNSTFGHNRVIAQGLIALVSGVPSVNTGFTSNGILALNYNSVTNELEVTIPRSTGASYSAPMIFVQNNDSGVAASRNTIVRQRGYDDTTGVVRLTFYDIVTNLNIDASTIASMFIFFKAEIN